MIWRNHRSFKRDSYLLAMKCSFHNTRSGKGIWQKWTTCPNTMARGPQRRGTQCNRICCIGLRPARKLCNNKWEILMITSPLSSNVRHRAMITPQWLFYEGVWVGHGPSQIFGWPPACPPSFLLNFTFKCVWLTYTADNFHPANFKRLEDFLATVLTIFASLCWV